MKKIIVSKCLCGMYCRYDGEIRTVPPKIKKLSGIIPVCPEQLGGLTTPRPSSKVITLAGKTRVIDKNGKDVTKYFVRGAQKVIEYAGKYKIKKAYLKTKSPSCGRGGITAQALKKQGIRITYI